MVDSFQHNGGAGSIELQDEELLAGSVSDSLSNGDSISHNQCTAPPILRKPDSPMTQSSPSVRLQGLGETDSQHHGSVSSPRIVTDEKLKCYDKFQNLPVVIEGPEFTQDYSYFL